MINTPTRTKPAKAEPVNHARLVAIAEDSGFLDLRDNTFADDALRPSINMLEVGNPNVWQLYFCVEWDSGRVLAGYCNQARLGWRYQNGLEAWFTAGNSLQDVERRTYQEHAGHWSEREKAAEILQVALQAQALLDAVPADQQIGDDVKAQVHALLTRGRREG